MKENKRHAEESVALYAGRRKRSVRESLAKAKRTLIFLCARQGRRVW